MKLLYNFITAPLSCGNPDRRVNSTVVGKNYSMGATVEYRCPTGSVTLGVSVRSCQTNGLWSDEPPTCKRRQKDNLLIAINQSNQCYYYLFFSRLDVDCGSLKGIKDGEVVNADGRTTFGASVKYSCAENYTLVGTDKRVCGSNGNWQPEEPKCLCKF